MVIKNTKKYNLFSAVFAFCLWGVWSFYVNSQAENWQVGAMSGFVQGLLSFCITLTMTILIERQFNFYPYRWQKLLLPPIMTVLITGSCLVVVHHLVGTPNILKTVSPALCVALLFAFFTNFKLYQQQN